MSTPRIKQEKLNNQTSIHRKPDGQQNCSLIGFHMSSSVILFPVKVASLVNPVLCGVTPPSCRRLLTSNETICFVRPVERRNVFVQIPRGENPEQGVSRHTMLVE